jgi:hypothetical protein
MNTIILQAMYVKDLQTVCQKITGIEIVNVVQATKPEDWHEAEIKSTLNKKQLAKELLNFPFVWVKEE